jgi:hypothetical protein
VIGKFPDDLFLSRDFKGLGLFAQKWTRQIIADDGVPIAQSLAAGWQSQ